MPKIAPISCQFLLRWKPLDQIERNRDLYEYSGQILRIHVEWCMVMQAPSSSTLLHICKQVQPILKSLNPLQLISMQSNSLMYILVRVYKMCRGRLLRLLLLQTYSNFYVCFHRLIPTTKIPWSASLLFTSIVNTSKTIFTSSNSWKAKNWSPT